MIFLPPPTELIRFESGEVKQYPPQIIDDVIEICQGCDFVGISLLTYYFDLAVQLSQALHERSDAKVLWGGVHSIIRPDESLKYADIISLGEAEDALVELLEKTEKGEDYTDIRTLGFRINGDIRLNPLHPLIQDLDEIPPPDFDPTDHYCLDHERQRVVPLSDELLKMVLIQGPLSPLGELYHYKTMTSRGCPHRCAYCCVSIYKDRYGKQKYLRWRSHDHVMDELKSVIKRFPWINAIGFFDDSLLAQPTERLAEFCERYKQEIGLPFAAQCSPSTTTYKKIELLVDAGMKYLEMGIQTGAERINKEIYNRPMPNSTVLKATQVISRFKDRILPPDYHLILDNPWATVDEKLDTLRLILEIPKPYGLKPSSLVLYPETGVYHRAIVDRLITDEHRDVYRKAFGAPLPTYINFLIFMRNYRWIPNFIFRLMMLKPLVKLLNRPMFSRLWIFLIAASAVISTLFRGFKALFTGDFARIRRFMEKRRKKSLRLEA